MDFSTGATIVTAIAAAAISYLLQKPYVRVVKMFSGGKVDYTTYKLKNAGAATAICVVLQDRSCQSLEAMVPSAYQKIFFEDSDGAKEWLDAEFGQYNWHSCGVCGGQARSSAGAVR